ncbi:MAG: hypothetical protein E6J91_46465 [Deltaproteobacteria bacterium]|nr:MAG: hypothetical protein E6J91_46465 [Deltaproteobacteria bacterium]
MLATGLVLVAAACHRGPQPATVSQPKTGVAENRADPAARRETVAWDAEERQYLTRLLAELQRSGERGGYPHLVDYVLGVRDLVERADRGELAKTELLMDARELEKAMTDPVGGPISQQLDDLREILRRARVLPP